MLAIAALPCALKRGVAGTLSALCLVVSSAVANDIQDANRLLKTGQHAQALARVNKILAADPKDPEARFLKGVILTEQGNAEAATGVFQRLTQDYPALPEPYNNLAVIYATQGQYDDARRALEKSIRTHPSYATAYENLGDVYSKLASDAYDRALRLDSTNTGASKKLALVRVLTGRETTGATQLAAASPAPAAASTTPSPSVTKSTRAASSSTRGQASSPPRQTTQAPITVAKTAAGPAPSAPAKTTQTAPDAAIRETVTGWAQAWSAKDVERYLAFYAPAFKTPGGEPRAAWEELRRKRVAGPNKIQVSISGVDVLRRDDARAAVTFRQRYRSDRFQGSTRKALELVRDGKHWLIVEERVIKK